MYSISNCHNVAKHTVIDVGLSGANIQDRKSTECFKKSFTTLEAFIYLFGGHVQYFELSYCSKTHRVLSKIVMVQYDYSFLRRASR
jgi:hypothetical protein